MHSNLFEEVSTLQEGKDLNDAKEYYDTILGLQLENYKYYEENEKIFKSLHTDYRLYVDSKFKKKEKELKDNFDHFQQAYDNGAIISHKFKFLKIDQLHKLPEDLKLPEWFEQFKIEEMEKVREQLNAQGLRMFRNRVNNSLISQRKKLRDIIHKKLKLIEEVYGTEDMKLNPPITKLNEVQHYIEELQAIDRVIPEMGHMLLQKAETYAQNVVKSFLEFREKSSKQILNIE